MKLAFLIVAYTALLMVLSGTVLNVLVDKFHTQGARVEFTLGQLMWMLIAPGTIAITVTAWTLRERWFDLRTPQVLVAALAMAVITVPIFLVIGLGTDALFHYERFSPTAWRMTVQLLMVLSGVVTAQVLRLRRRSTTSAYV